MLHMFVAAMLMIPAVQATSQRPEPEADPQPETRVVLTGCVAMATEGKDTRFMLINASPAPAGVNAAQTAAPETGSTGVGTTGTGTSGTGSSASPTTVQDTAQVNVLLTSGPKLSLRRHVNRRVEVEGTMGRSAEPPNADELRQVRVTKVRRLSGACSGKQ